ncbi:mCG145128, partial [Mus musculus]
FDYSCIYNFQAPCLERACSCCIPLRRPRLSRGNLSGERARTTHFVEVRGQLCAVSFLPSDPM